MEHQTSSKGSKPIGDILHEWPGRMKSRGFGSRYSRRHSTQHCIVARANRPWVNLQVAREGSRGGLGQPVPSLPRISTHPDEMLMILFGC